MHQPDDDMNPEQLRVELQRLKEERKNLMEENEALSIRTNGVQVLSKLLDQSRQEAATLKRKLSEKTADGKLWSIGSKDAVRRASSSGSLEKVGGTSLISLNPSPWSTMDGNALNEVTAELKDLLEKNKELTVEIEKTLRDEAKINGDDGILVEHLNRLKVELDNYQSRLQGNGDNPGKLQDEANRLKAKLTDIAIQRGTKCGRLQDEIDLIKRKLHDIEERMSINLQDNQGDDEMEAEDSPPIFIKPSGVAYTDKNPNPFDFQSASCSGGAMVEALNEQSKTSEVASQVPVVKPRNDLIEEIERKSQIIDDLQQQNELIISEKDELIKVNHEWDAQYKKLQDYFRKELKGRDESVQKLQRELSQEHTNAHGSVKVLLDQKDCTIEEQNTKIRKLREELERIKLDGMQMLQKKVETDTEAKYQKAKKLWQDQKKENEILIRKEETALQEIVVLKDAVEVLERETKSLHNRNRLLERDVERLTSFVEQGPERRSWSSPPSMFQSEPPLLRQASRVSEEQVELLKQQISIYVEDFNTEKKEKEKYAEQVNKMKIELRKAQSEATDCRRQMRMLENDLDLAREENMRLSRLRFYDYDEEGAGYLPKPPPVRKKEYPDEDMRRRRDIYELRQEKAKIDDRLADLQRLQRPDHFANTGFAGRGPNQSTAPSQKLPDNPSDNDMFFGGQVVRDVNGRDTKCTNCGECFGSSTERFRHQLGCTHN